jgi:phosphotransferase system enzyme I (PtsP)
MVPMIDNFAREADFLSIGTNDLIQYLLAVDRTNEKVAHLYLPHHPAVLRTLRQVVAGGARHGVPVSVCGDMAHQRRYLPFLLGIGVRWLSVEPIYLSAVQAEIARIDLADAAPAVERILAAATVEEVAALLPAEEYAPHSWAET